jgi:hypothetical protein
MDVLVEQVKGWQEQGAEQQARCEHFSSTCIISSTDTDSQEQAGTLRASFRNVNHVGTCSSPVAPRSNRGILITVSHRSQKPEATVHPS